MGSAELLAQWRRDLESWAIPPEILAAASESPWALPSDVFVRRAERRENAPSGPSFERALEALLSPGSVLDIGAGAGAACLPLRARTTSISAVDSDPEMLAALAATAARLGTEVDPTSGRWPDVAGDVPPADVVTCHHVLYNVADLGPFVAELTSHARRRVVVEITARHPMSSLNPLWQRFHGLQRPEVPTAADVVAILEAMGLAPSHETWSRPSEPEYEHFEGLVEATRRRLCLDPNRSDELASALLEAGIKPGPPVELDASPSELVTIWWGGSAR